MFNCNLKNTSPLLKSNLLVDKNATSDRFQQYQTSYIYFLRNQVYTSGCKELIATLVCSQSHVSSKTLIQPVLCG